jgi:hypothetical protein
MSLYPGSPRDDGSGNYILDDIAIEESMAKAMEDALKDIYLKVKKSNLSDIGQEDRRMLFVAIARGILQYLEAHHEEAIQLKDSQLPPVHKHSVDLEITMNSHKEH